MSREVNTTQCSHGKGLACRICYDQRINDQHNRAARERARAREAAKANQEEKP